MKIIVIGAGAGGLSAAYGLAKGGHDVTVYEKEARENIGHDWHDDVNPEVFYKLNIPLPKSAFRKGNWSFCVPGSNKWLKLELKEEQLDFSMERRELSEILIKRAEEAGAKLVFNTEVSSLIIKNNCVTGVKIDGKPEYAALVSDASGLFSKFRASLPSDSLVTGKPERDEIFYAYRAFYSSTGAPANAVHTNKAYLKHLGRQGISWCITGRNGTLDVLVGKTGGITETEINDALIALRADNPTLGKDIRRGGIVCAIPIRYPLPVAVYNGYAALGDAAFMTIPMLGSGVSAAINAGKMLADAVNKHNLSGVSALWDYQVEFIKEIGSKHIAIDILKRWLLSVDVKELAYFFENGVITAKDMEAGALGGTLKPSVSEIAEKLKLGWKKVHILLSLNSAMTRGKKAGKLFKAIPEKYDYEKISEWKKRVEKLF